MAIPPNSTEAFVREVDENLRRDEMNALARRYGRLALGVMVAILLAVAGWLYWQNRQEKIAGEQGEALSALLDKAGDPAAARTMGPQLDAIAGRGDGAMSAAARFTRAALLLQSGDQKGALTMYRALADDKGVPTAQRELASLRVVQLDYDRMTPDATIAALDPLARPGLPFYGSAGELKALALIAKGDQAGAGTLLRALAFDQAVPPSIRNRAAEMASALGLDMSSFTPVRDPAAQQ